MKKTVRKILFLVLMACLLTACSRGEDSAANVNRDTDENPVIVLGDENLPDPKEESKTPAMSVSAQNVGIPEEKDEETVSKNVISENVISDETQSGNSVSNNAILLIGSAPRNADVLVSSENEDGGYTEELSCENGNLFLTIVKEKNHGNLLKEKALKEGWTEISIAEDDEELSELTGIPVRRYQFQTGEGEETNQHKLVFFDDGEYGFTLDCYTELTLFDDYEELMEAFISSASISDGAY